MKQLKAGSAVTLLLAGIVLAQVRGKRTVVEK